MYYGYYHMEEKNKQTNFHFQLRSKLDEYVHKVYDVTLHFPSNEQFGVTSQLRRATLSIMLNYIEGFARKRKLVLKQFLEISYGSLKESGYLLLFSHKRGYMNEKNYLELSKLADELGRMIWGILEKI